MLQNFTHLAEAIRKEYEQKKADKIYYIRHGYIPTWAAEHCTDFERGLKEYSTPAKWEAFKNGAITREKAEAHAITRALKALDKSEKIDLEKLATVAACPAADWLTISVNWTRSKTWGYNPHAIVTTDRTNTEGTASGCGYDKESAAVAHALNDSPAILRILYETAENALKNGYKLPKDGSKWGGVLGYGSGYSILPAFEGGCGCSCFRSIFEKCGYTWKTGRSSDTYNGYTVVKEG